MRLLSPVSLTVLSAGLLLAGCNSTPATQVLPDGAIAVPTAADYASTGRATIPKDWPADVAIYTGSEVTYAATLTPAAGISGNALILSTSDDTKTVATFYKDAIKKAGWTVTATMENAGTTIMSGTKDGRTLSLLIGDAGDGKTAITLGIEKAK